MPLQSRVRRIARGFARAAFLAGVAALVLCGGTVWAQNIGQTTGQIEGVVVDATGAVLPGVTITVTSPALTGSKVVVSGGNGEYVVPGLPTGAYKLEAVLDGFISVTVENIVIKPGVVIKPNVKMSPGLKSEVTVVASPVLDVLSTAASSNLSAKTIDELPKGRTWESVVQLAPAVNYESITSGSTTGVSFRGASISENSYIVDGVDTTAVVVGNTGQGVALEFVDEVQVKSGFVGAEYGGALGGIVNVVTKSGSNTLRGVVNFQLSGSGLSVGPRPRLRLVPTNSTKSEYVTDPEDPSQQYDFGVTVGGKIVQDRVWFFGGWMPQYINTDRTVTFLSNNKTDTFTSATRRNYAMGKITIRPSDAMTLNGTASVSPAKVDGLLPSADGTGATNVDYSTQGSVESKYSYSFGMDWIPSSRFFVNAFVGYMTKTGRNVGIPIANRYRFVTSNYQFTDIPSQYQGPAGYETSSDNFSIEANDEARFSVGVTGTFSFNAAGRHLLKFGTQYARPTTYLLSGYTGEIMSLYWGLSTFGQRGTYGYYRITDIATDGHVVSNNQAIFVQDQWSLDRFTINAGLRMEREHLIPYSDTPGDTRTILFGFGDKLAPRVGVSWDVRGDSRWKIYANGGMFYDLMKQSVARDGFGGGVFKFDYYTLDIYQYDTLKAASPNGRKIATLDLRGTGDVLDPDIKPAKTLAYDFGTEFQISPTVTASVGYVYRAASDAIEDAFVLQPNGTTFVKTLGNPGIGLLTQTYGSSYPGMPKFERTYKGVDLQIHKRLSRNWTANAAYTYSTLRGNYDGLADADQQYTTDVNPNLGLYCDYLEGCYTAGAAVDSGILATDRPHQFKANGSYNFPFGLTIGAFFQAISGKPVTPTLSVNSATITHPEGRAAAGRTPTWTQTDLSFNYRFKMGATRSLSFIFNVINLFDQDTSLRRYQTISLSALSVPRATYFAGFDYKAAMAAAGLAQDPRYLLDDRFQAPRAARIGIRFDF